MFNDVHSFAALWVWTFPVISIIAFIKCRSMLKPKEWVFFILLSVVLAAAASCISLSNRDEGIIMPGQEYASCKLMSINAPGEYSMETVTLDCDGEQKIVNKEYYDKIMKRQE